MISDLDKVVLIFMYVYVLNIYSAATLTTQVIHGFKTLFFFPLRLIYDIFF